MTHVRRFTVNPLRENCYVLHDDTLEGVIIDCGALSPHEQADIRTYIEAQGIRLRYALQTHMHFDHVFGLDFLHQTYNLQPRCHAAEHEVYAQNPSLALQLCGLHLPLPQVPLGPPLAHGEILLFGQTFLHVLHTPGHTPGGVCFHCKEHALLFTGDTLFQGSIGRTDTPLGSLTQEIASIRTHLLPLPPDTRIYPGHGDETTIRIEKEENPYL